MAFYAKGSPNAFLHLTQTADARAGITDDTIFHSDLPYIMFDGVWETTLTNLPAAASGANTSGMINKDMVNYLPKLRVGAIPAGAIAALNDPNSVVLTEIEFTIGGVTRTKLISGVTVEVGRQTTNFEGYAGKWNINILARPGVDAHIGYYKGGVTVDPRTAIQASGSMGFETYVLEGSSNDGTGDFAPEAYYRIGYNRWGAPFYKPSINNKVKLSTQGNNFDTVCISPMCRTASPNVWGIARPGTPSAGGRVEIQVEKWGRPENTDGYLGRRIPMASTANNKFYWGGASNGAEDMYGEYSEYTGITYTKVRWYKLNLRFTMGTGFSVNRLTNLGQEIKISGSEFIVGGKKFNSVTTGILYQVNRKTRPNLKLLAVQGAYTTPNVNVDRAVIPVSGIDANGNFASSTVDAKSTALPNTTLANSYVAVVNPNSSTKWFCTSDSIGDQYGVIWGKGADKALQLLGGRTAKVTFGDVISKIAPNNNNLVRVAKVALGLPKTGDSTVVAAITTSDFRLIMPMDAYFCSDFNGYWDRPTERWGDPKYHFEPSDPNWAETLVGDYSILNLPINKYVPIMINRFSNMETLWWSTPASEGYQHTCIYWLKNAGDGSIEVYMTQRRDKKFEYLNHGIGTSYTQLFIAPKLNLYVARLS